MSQEIALPQRILDAAEAVLRRHGAEKTNVVDIARALGMSHGNIYRHYPSKKAILDAVVARWMSLVTVPLTAIAKDRTKPAPERLALWFDTLREAKRRKVVDDPELFRVYHGIVETMREVVAEHVTSLLGQVESMITEGVAAGDFSPTLDPATAAQAFLQATVAFHHPALITQRFPSDEEARLVLKMLLAGMRAGVS